MIKLFANIFRITLPLVATVALAQEPSDIVLPGSFDSSLSKQSGPQFHFGGYLKNETAYRFDEPRLFTKIRNIVSLNAGVDFGSSVKLYTSGWYYYDVVYDLFNYDTIVARSVRDAKEPLVFIEQLQKEKDSPGKDIREAYMDLYLNKLDVRVGRQYIVWGVLEGIRIVDEINPMDFRELILPDLLDYRIPLWSVKTDYYGDNTNYQFVWIPDLTFHKPAPPGSEWELFQKLPRTTAPDWRDPRFHEYGLRATKQIFDAEVSLSYFYTWDDYPTTFRVISAKELRRPTPTTELAILPTYTRNSIFGSTFVKEVQGKILKGEFAFVTGKYFAIVGKDDNKDGYLDSDGELKKNHLRWGLGYDFNAWGADFSPAIAQWIVLNYDHAMLTDQFDTTLNLFIRKPLPEQSAVFTLLLIHLVNFNEILAKPRFIFNLTDKFQLITGLDLFIGARTQFGRASSTAAPGGLVDIEQRAQFFGNFKDNRRLIVEFKYSF